MNLAPEKTVEKLSKLLGDREQINYAKLKKANKEILTLRSQVIGLMNDMEEYGYGGAPPPRKPTTQTYFVEKRSVTLVIPEPLPAQRELSSALEQHWVSMIQEAIAKEAETGIPKWEKAHVLIDITTPRGTRNYQVWDTSNRAINVIINNLKGVFFKDDNFEHLSCGIEARWGGIGETKLYICAYEDRHNPEIWGQKQENP